MRPSTVKSNCAGPPADSSSESTAGKVFAKESRASMPILLADTIQKKKKKKKQSKKKTKLQRPGEDRLRQPKPFSPSPAYLRYRITTEIYRVVHSNDFSARG